MPEKEPIYPEPPEQTERDLGVRIYGPLDVIKEYEKFEGATIKTALRDFLGLDEIELKQTLEEVQKHVEGFSHVGIEVRSIKAAVDIIQQAFKHDNYHLDKEFSSASVPKMFEGSTGRVGLLVGKEGSIPIELFEIKWGGRNVRRNILITGEKINHLALRASSPQGAQEVLSILKNAKEGVKFALEPTVNEETGEVFGYLENPEGRILEVIYHPEENKSE